MMHKHSTTILRISVLCMFTLLGVTGCGTADEATSSETTDSAEAEADSSTTETSVPDTADTTDTTYTTDTTDPVSEIDWASLNGTQPAAAKALPDFQALNFDTSERTQAALLGQPTILWFFPFAGTPG